jgi:hypothetical protein
MTNRHESARFGAKDANSHDAQYQKHAGAQNRRAQAPNITPHSLLCRGRDQVYHSLVKCCFGNEKAKNFTSTQCLARTTVGFEDNTKSRRQSALLCKQHHGRNLVK